MRAHHARRVLESDIGPDNDGNRQFFAFIPGPLPQRAQIPAKIQLDQQFVVLDMHEPVIGSIIHAGIGVLRDNHAAGDVATAIIGRVTRQRQIFQKVGIVAVNRLHRSLIDFLRRDRVGEPFADIIPEA